MSHSGRRIAVIGAGPAGLYAAATLLSLPTVAGVDVFDELPAPYGLVRYGVAADHPKTKQVTRVFAKVLADERVRFFGNVAVGTDLDRRELRAHYDAVVYATGARHDRDLDIPGEHLPGSHGAAQFVSWYSGHPGAALGDIVTGVTSAVVIGAGNVALDVVRILARDARDLRDTDMPDPVVDILARSTVTDIHLLARRGPHEARFTPVEVRELVELRDVDVVVDPADVTIADDELAGDPQRNLRLLREASRRAAGGHRRRVHLQFWRQPIAIEGTDGATAVVSVDPRTGATSRVDAQLVLRAIGYRATPVPGLPFDDLHAVVPHDAGRVLQRPGEYVAGWLKRGPSGVIGTNRRDATETVHSIAADLAELPARSEVDPQAIVGLLHSRGVRVVNRAAWLRLESHEATLGGGRGTATVKLAQRAAMLDICLPLPTVE